MYEIYLDAPNLGKREKEYLNRAIDENYISIYGPYVPQFEERFAKFIDTRKAVSVQSGTAAIHIALYELGIGPGDEVIVPALSFVATANPILYVGAIPVFVDVNIDTWNIESEEIEKVITEKTKAIIPVHLYGIPSDMDSIIEIATRYNLYIIEDATESLGATYKGKMTGTFGDFGCFSFNGNKLITTGGGGMIVTNNIKKGEHIKFLVNQARDAKRGYYHPELGFNYRMTNLEASLGLAQMERIEEFLNKKRKFAEIYREELGNSPYIKFQSQYPNSEPSYWLNAIFIEKDINIEEFRKKLLDRGIPTRRIFVPMVEFPYFEKRMNSYKNSYKIYERGLCLPSSTLNKEEDIFAVCKVIKELL